LTLAARRYARHLGSHLRRAYGGGDEYTAAQIRVASENAARPLDRLVFDAHHMPGSSCRIVRRVAFAHEPRDGQARRAHSAPR
jgi:hypothetical protein